MKTISLTVEDRIADALLRHHGGQHLDPKTGEVFADVPAPPVRVDVRASRNDEAIVRPRDFPAERSRR